MSKIGLINPQVIKVWRILQKIQRRIWARTTGLSIQREQIQNTESASKSVHWCRWKCDWSSIWQQEKYANKLKTSFDENSMTNIFQNEKINKVSYPVLIFS